MKKENYSIPKFLSYLLDLVIEEADKLHLNGDYEEIYGFVYKNEGKTKAYLWILRQIFKSTVLYFSNLIIWNMSMFSNYLKIAIRNLKKQKIFSVINILGFALGIACCIMILLYVQYELSYDRFHKNAGRIFRITNSLNFGGKKSDFAVSPAPLGPALESDFDGILHAVRFAPVSSVHGSKKILVNYDNMLFYEEKWFYSDPSVFKILTFPFVKGNSETCLNEPFSLVISERVAEKYFGNISPLGRTLVINDNLDFKITGVMKNIPENSHFHFDFLASFGTLNDKRFRLNLTNWLNNAYYTYILLKKNIDIEAIKNGFPEFIEKNANKSASSVITLHMQALTDIHLHSNLDFEIEANSSVLYIYIFSVSALIILLIACVNFMNLTTARSMKRAGEIGIRKVMGAYRGKLIKQFLSETMVMTFISMIIAVILVKLLIPYYRSFIEQEIPFHIFDNNLILWGLIGTGVFAGFFSGIYPAVILSGFKPVKVLKGDASGNPGRNTLKKGLIVFQFTMSIILIVCAITISSQIKYIKKKNPGFNKEHVVILPVRDRSVKDRFESFKNELIKSPFIVNVSGSSGIPGNVPHIWFIRSKDVEDINQAPTMNVIMVDYDFIKTLGIEMVQGRDFSRKFSGDENNTIIINEAAAAKLGWREPLGKNIKTENKDGFVIGVVKDFHFLAFNKKIEPLVIYIYPRHFRHILIRIASGEIKSSVEFIRNKWEKVNPHHPFEYTFLDKEFEKRYISDEKTGKIIGCFSTLAIILSCLGLLGLVSYSAEQKTKQIGIRKVLGASIPVIVKMLISDFFRLVLISNFIGWPLAFYFMNKWLQNFAYHTNIKIWFFILSAGISIIVAFLSVIYQAVKAAIAKPIDAIRYE